jgi:hypothetical protein
LNEAKLNEGEVELNEKEVELKEKVYNLKKEEAKLNEEMEEKRNLKLLCQIKNVPPEASFKYDVLNGNVKRYYIVMQSAFEGYLDIKEFMIFPENGSEEDT